MNPLRHYILLLLLLFVNLTISAQIPEKIKQATLQFSKPELTIKQALEEMNEVPGISIVYNGTEPFLKTVIEFGRQTITIAEALQRIEEHVPVEVIFNNNHIIVKSKKLAEKYILKGNVTDATTMENLSAADIFIGGTSKVTITDTDGYFEISLSPGNYRIKCKYMGYKEREMDIYLFGDTDINIPMEPLVHELVEVNVVGTLNEEEDYERGRTIEKIDARTIDRLNTNDANDALHGRINGVWATKMSGAPGDHNKIRIRGINSIFGSTDPLYVVDGVIIPVANFKSLGISDLNSHDIKSMTVLKDASSTALYGYLGGNGVILIETKKGSGKPSFNFSVKKGYQQFSKRYPLMDAETFLSTLDSSDSQIWTNFYRIDAAVNHWEEYPYFTDSSGNTLASEDFQEELFRTGSINEVQLSGQGSLKNHNYYFSGNYYEHNGILINSGYTKYTFAANLSTQIRDVLFIRAIYKSSHQENKNNLDNYMGNNVILKGINYEPAYRATPDSFLLKRGRLYYNGLVGDLTDCSVHPDQLFYEQEKKKIENTHSANLMLNYPFSELFSFDASYSLAIKDLQYSSYVPAQLNQVPEKALLSNENFVIFNQEYNLRYNQVINNNNLSAFVRYRNYKDNVYWNVDSVLNVDLNSMLPEDNIYLRGSQSIYGEKGSVIRSINSLIANFNYTYKEKYSLSVITNLDHLKEGYYVNKTELFSSLAADWNLAKEEFLHTPQWLNGLHLYFNWGQSGNYPLNSLSNDLYSSTSSYTSNDSVVYGTTITNLANHYLTHEKITEGNIGIKFEVLKNRIMISADYYQRNYSNLLIQRAIPNYYGGGTFYQNIGEMKNTGIELSLEIMPVDRPDFEWIMRANYSTNNQYITKLYKGEEISFNNTDVLYPDFYARENDALGSITGYSYQGVWDDSLHSVEIDGSPVYIQHRSMAYLRNDTSDHSVINENDKTVIGNSIPDFTCSWINAIRYKNFSCEMLWYAVAGIDKYNATKAATYVTGTNEAVRDIVLDSLYCLIDNVFYESSFFVEDASFIRLKTLSFTYTQPKKIANKISAEYTLSFENLLTFTRYTGYDPEATIYTDNNFTDNAIDRGSYPNPRGVYFSINLSF